MSDSMNNESETWNNIEEATEYLQSAKPSVDLVYKFHQQYGLNVTEGNRDSVKALFAQLKGIYGKRSGYDYESLFGSFPMSDNAVSEIMSLYPVSWWPAQTFNWMIQAEPLQHQLRVALDSQCLNYTRKRNLGLMDENSEAFLAALKGVDNPPAWECLLALSGKAPARSTSSLQSSAKLTEIKKSLQTIVLRYCSVSTEELERSGLLSKEDFLVDVANSEVNKIPESSYMMLLEEGTPLVAHSHLLNSLSKSDLNDTFVERYLNLLVSIDNEGEHTAIMRQKISQVHDRVNSAMSVAGELGEGMSEHSLQKLVDFGGLPTHAFKHIDFGDYPVAPRETSRAGEHAPAPTQPKRPYSVPSR